MSDTGTRVYELGYILVPNTPETEVPSHVDTLKKAITDLGGEIHSSGAPEFIDLAYQMEKNIASKKMKWNQGYFGWMKFTVTPDALEALKKVLDANVNIIRHLLIKTDAENSVVFKKPKVEAKRASLEEEVLLEDGEVLEEEDMKADHEKLPDLEVDIAPVVEGKEGEE